MKNNRRVFMMRSFAGAGALATLAIGNSAQAQATVADTDPQAMALGYKSDATKIDTQKHPKYAADQSCSGCALYQGKPADSAGACAVFGGKLVSSKGWCSAWTKKA